MNASFANDGRDPATEARRLFTRNQRYEFRLMAAYPEIVEAEIAKGTDERPTSHRQVMQAIRAHRGMTAQTERSTLSDRVAELESAVSELEQIVVHLWNKREGGAQ
jgi:hypothetical protein